MLTDRELEKKRYAAEVIDRIRALEAQGKRDEAAQLLNEFALKMRKYHEVQK